MHGCIRWVFRPIDLQPAEGGQILAQDTIDLDGRRGMAAQKATGMRRQLAAAALQAREEELEHLLLAGPATGWGEAVAKARYLLILFAQTPAAEDPRRATLIADVFADFKRLLTEPKWPPGAGDVLTFCHRNPPLNEAHGCEPGEIDGAKDD
jgi:hypothetical protein